MSYSKQNFTPGSVLYASQLNAMDNQIASNEAAINSIQIGVTPEMYGAYGDGVHDDAPALKAALESGKPVKMTQDLYLFSPIEINDHNVRWDGDGYTVHIDGEDAPGYGNQLRFIMIRSVYHDGIAEDADVVIYTENSTAVLNPGFPNESEYRRGYLSYHGFNPTPDKEEYADYSAHSWYEHRADIRNINFIGKNTEAMDMLAIWNMCNSNIDNCYFTVEEGHDAARGFSVNNGYNIKITRCRADGINARRLREKTSAGYGFSVSGDAITVDNCTLKNSKCGVVPGGGGEYMSTGIIISHLTVQVKDTGELANTGARVYQQCLDIHEGCIRPLITDCYLEYENATPYNPETGDGDLVGAIIHVSCPESTLVNIQAQYKTLSGWNSGYIGFGPLVKKCNLINVYAKRCRLYGHGWGFERGNAYDANYIREINVLGGEFSGIRLGEGLVKFRLSGCKVTGKIEATNTIYAENCVFRPEDRIEGSPTIIITGEGFFNHCDISSSLYKNLETGTIYAKSIPVIKAPENTIHLTGCIIRKPTDRVTFKTTQTDLVNNATYDLYGLVLGSEMPNGYVDGDECALDAYDLW